MGRRGPTLNQFLRGVSRASRSIERDSQRRQKLQVQEILAYRRMEALQDAASEVAAYEGMILSTRSLHIDCTPEVDWSDVRDEKIPPLPSRRSEAENGARYRAEIYRPALLDKWFGGEAKKRAALKADIEKAIENDSAQYEAAMKRHAEQVEEIEDRKKLADRVLAGELESYREVFEELAEESGLTKIGIRIDFQFTSAKSIKAVLQVLPIDRFPTESKSLLKSGKVSCKELPVSKRNEMYQDYVCSALLRVAREILAFVPVEEVEGIAAVVWSNLVTGKDEVRQILSVRFSRDRLKDINFANIDPSLYIESLPCQMEFKKATGFKPID